MSGNTKFDIIFRPLSLMRPAHDDRVSLCAIEALKPAIATLIKPEMAKIAPVTKPQSRMQRAMQLFSRFKKKKPNVVIPETPLEQALRGFIFSKAFAVGWDGGIDPTLVDTPQKILLRICKKVEKDGIDKTAEELARYVLEYFTNTNDYVAKVPAKALILADTSEPRKENILAAFDATFPHAGELDPEAALLKHDVVEKTIIGETNPVTAELIVKKAVHKLMTDNTDVAAALRDALNAVIAPKLEIPDTDAGGESGRRVKARFQGGQKYYSALYEVLKILSVEGFVKGKVLHKENESILNLVLYDVENNYVRVYGDDLTKFLYDALDHHEQLILANISDHGLRALSEYLNKYEHQRLDYLSDASQVSSGPASSGPSTPASTPPDSPSSPESTKHHFR